MIWNVQGYGNFQEMSGDGNHTPVGLRTRRPQSEKVGSPQLNDNGLIPAPVKQITFRKKGLSLILKIFDMWCPACTWVIEEGLERAQEYLRLPVIFLN